VSAEFRKPAELADEVARAAARPGAARTLLVDVDGTLAPIAPTPEAARIPETTLDALDEVMRRGFSVCAVSGRPAAEVRILLPVASVRVFGSHGLEADGAAPAIEAAVLRRLEDVGAAAVTLETSWPGVRIERKPAGIAFHDRQLASGRVPQWRCERDRWLAARDLTGLETLAGKRVLELRPRGFHKGRVVEQLAEGLGVRVLDPSFVAVGDDITDEDMFREIRGRGLGVLVGPARATLAARRLGGPEDVGSFLAALSAARGT
jgi:trehalose-phosphatase